VRDSFQCGLIDHRDLMIAGDGGKNLPQFRNCEHAVHTTKTIQIGDDSTVFGIEDHQLIGVHVRDIQAAGRNIEALIIEANRWARQRNVCDNAQDLVSVTGGGTSEKTNRKKDQRQYRRRDQTVRCVWFALGYVAKWHERRLADEPAHYVGRLIGTSKEKGQAGPDPVKEGQSAAGFAAFFCASAVQGGVTPFILA